MRPHIYIPTITSVILIILCFWYVDIPVLHYFKANQQLNSPAEFISLIGTYYDIVIGLILAGWVWCHRHTAAKKKQALFFAICWAVSNGAGTVLKFIFGRYRPKMLLSKNLYGFHGFSGSHGLDSFPSGHTLDAVAIAAALWVLWPRSRPYFVFWVIAMGLSRIIVRAHYVSDVLAAVLLGIVCVYFIKKWIDPNAAVDISTNLKSRLAEKNP